MNEKIICIKCKEENKAEIWRRATWATGEGSFEWCDQGSLSEKMEYRCEHRKELAVENEGEDHHVRE